MTEHQWSEAFYWAFFHAGEPFLEWIVQLLVKTQQLSRATDKAAVYAFICKLVFKKRSKRKETHACHLSRYLKKIIQGTALHACMGGWELLGLGREGRSRETQVKRLPNPFLSLPPSQHISLFLLIFFLPLLLLLFFSDQAWWQTALTWLAWNPESGWCHCCCEFLLPFTRAPSGACRIVVWQLRSEKAQADRFYFNVFIMSLCQHEEEEKPPWNHLNYQRISSDWPNIMIHEK